MKKVLFTVLAAFVMTVGFSSCKDSKNSANKEDMEMDDMDDDDDMDDEEDVATLSTAASADADTPEAKALALMENLVNTMKATTINSVADLKAMGEKFKQFRKESEELDAMYGEDYESSLPEKEQKELEQKIQKISMEMITEMQRIQEEATKAGIAEKEMQELFQ